MNFFNIVLGISAIIVAVSLGYRILYIMFFMTNAENDPSISFYLSRYSPLTLFIPFKQLLNNDLENKKRKKANIALYIFYVSLIVSMIASAFIK